MTRRILVGAFFAAAALLRAQSPQIGNCAVFPADNIWNTRVDQLPVSPSSSTWVSTIGASAKVHADFGAGLWDGGPIGIPFVTVPGSQQKFSATFLYADESDAGPYAVPQNAPIEGGSNSTGDRHAIAIDVNNCILYELYRAFPQGSSWKADSGAIYNLQSHALRPLTWTSADAAGLPIFPGLIRYDEILTGEIRHAIRFTVPKTQRAYVWPARHYASSLTSATYPPMGARFRLRADFDISKYSQVNQIILTAMKRYGMLLADNGSAWYISGSPDERWNNDDLHALGAIPGSAFEAVDTASLMVNVNSGQAKQTQASVTVSPASASVAAGAAKQFQATVTNLSDNAVTWDVNGAVGGNASVGFIDSITGLFTAPMNPTPPVTVRATSKVNTAISGTATVTITAVAQPVTISISPDAASVRIAGKVRFTATVSNTGNRSVTWLVNGIVGGNSQVGQISGQGIYLAPNSPVSVTVTARSNADPTKTASATVAVTGRQR